MHYKTINLNVFLEAEAEGWFPNPVMLANDLTDALHKDWQNTDNGEYSVRFVPTISNDAISEFQHQAKVLGARLKQEQKLTKHLDNEVADLKASIKGWQSNYAKQEKLVETIDAEVGRMELQTNNLTEKNDNQVDIIEAQRAEIAGLENSLMERTDSLDVSQHEWKLRGERILEWKAMAEQRGIELIDANQEAQNHALMIHKIVDAMTSAGYDISGWGNDADLEELERRATDIEDAAAKIEVASGALNLASIDLDAKLDNIRTER